LNRLVKQMIKIYKLELDMDEKNYVSYYARLYHKTIVLSYKGPMNHAIIAGISNEIEKKFKKNSKVSRKLFSIFLEVAQNIFYYSAEVNQFANQDKVGVIVIGETDEYYLMTSGNLVFEGVVQELKQRCEYINSLDTEALRKHRLDLVEKNEEDNPKSRGAGIGLVKVALVSENPLNIEMEKIDDQFTFFTLTVKISK
jgi:uncharacterized protein YneR